MADLGTSRGEASLRGIFEAKGLADLASYPAAPPESLLRFGGKWGRRKCAAPGGCRAAGGREGLRDAVAAGSRQGLRDEVAAGGREGLGDAVAAGGREVSGRLAGMGGPPRSGTVAVGPVKRVKRVDATCSTDLAFVEVRELH